MKRARTTLLWLIIGAFPVAGVADKNGADAYRKNAFSIQPGESVTGRHVFITPLAQSFEILTDDTVLDHASLLTWMRRDDGVMRDWQEAVEYCDSLELDNRRWRLPQRAELLSLVDYNRSDPAIDLYYFPETRLFNYWASTPYTGTPTHAWSVLFSEGNAYCFLRQLKNYTRCVSDHEA